MIPLVFDLVTNRLKLPVPSGVEFVCLRVQSLF